MTTETISQTVSELLASAIRDLGVETVFGLPGGENVEVLDALRRAGLDFVLVHNESSAVFMADMTARLTGKPSVCMTTLGPGAMNAAVGLGHAYLDRAPILLLTAHTPERLLPGHTHQVIDISAVFTPLTKGTFTLHAHDAGDTIAKALTVLTTGRPGPVHLQIDKETATQTVASIVVPEIAPAQNLLSDDHEVSKAFAVLAEAKRPVIVTGVGLEPDAPYEALRELAEALNAPVISTPKAKGGLSDQHPLAGGTIGLTMTDPAYEILDEADCVLAVGFDVVELVKPWHHNAPLIWVASWQNHDPVLPCVAEIVGSLGESLQRLTDAAVETESSWGTERVAAFRQKLAGRQLPDPASGRLLPQTVLNTLRAHTPDDVIVTIDVGSHKIFTSLEWQTYATNSFFVSNGLSSMGFALPAAIAAAMAKPSTQVLCITGDGGMAMAVGELALLAKHQLSVTVVVMQDNALDLIRSAQTRAGKPVLGTEFVSPDFTVIAGAYGIASQRVTTEEECMAAIQQAMTTKGPMLIEAWIDPVSYPTTPK